MRESFDLAALLRAGALLLLGLVRLTQASATEPLQIANLVPIAKAAVPGQPELFRYTYRVSGVAAASSLPGAVAIGSSLRGNVSVSAGRIVFGAMPKGVWTQGANELVLLAGPDFDRRLDTVRLGDVEELRRQQLEHPLNSALLAQTPAPRPDGKAVEWPYYYSLKLKAALAWRSSLDVGGIEPLTIRQQAPSGIVKSNSPVIQASFQGGYGVDPAGITLTLDGVDLSAKLQFTAGSLNYASSGLAQGTHQVQLQLRDQQGRTAQASWSFSVDSEPPLITEQAPKDTLLRSGAGVVLKARISDAAGLGPIQLWLDDVDISAGLQVSEGLLQRPLGQALADGLHRVRLQASDALGNQAQSEWMFAVGAPPVISDTTPNGVVLAAGARPTISANFADERAAINLASLRLIVNSEDVTGLAIKTAGSISYTPPKPLAPGLYTVYLELSNTSKVAASAVWGFEVAAPKSYSLEIKSPAGDASVITPRVSVQAEAKASASLASRMTVNDADMQLTGVGEDGAAQFSGEVELLDGLNTVTVKVFFDDGETRSASVQLRYDAPARISILSPADQAVLGRAQASSPGDLTGNVERPVTVSGRLSKPVVSVTVNQQEALLSDGGLAFSFPNFFLHEGANLLTAVATDALGRVSGAAVNVTVDQTAPILNVEYPKPRQRTRAGWIDVRGMVNDAVEAAFGAPEPEVFVSADGQPEQRAEVADRYFFLSGVALRPGLNRLRVRAADHLGNERVQTIEVHQADTGLGGLLMVEGHNQTAAAKTELAKPLAVMALDARGEPLVGQAVRFEVQRGTGAISPVQGQTASGDRNYTARVLTLKTDAEGRAQVWFTLGKQSGPGANVVQATAVGLDGEALQFSASTLRGAVARLQGDQGLNQISETGAQAMEILSAVVRDAGGNPLPLVPVRFQIDSGDAFFADALGASVSADRRQITVNSDKNGVVAARPTLGLEPGLVQLSARALKQPGGSFETPADTIGGPRYVLRVKQAQDGPASFAGHIYTDKGAPLPGVKLSIGRTALLATSDDKGFFQIDNVPPGRVDLFVDGRAVNPSNDPSKPQWPSLHFEAYVVRGQKNELPHAIYLPALLSSEAKIVGGSEDVVLKIPGLEGFQMTVKANSVTFPDGSRVGTLVVSPVTADKLPMAPPAGGARFGVPAWTIQPAGTRFDPPIEVQMPNATFEQAGDNVPVVQWDHDLAQYVPMGRATVSNDGALLITDAGSGITKAGWGAPCTHVYDDECKTAVSPTPCEACRKWEQRSKCEGSCVKDIAYTDTIKGCCDGDKYDKKTTCCVPDSAGYGFHLKVRKRGLPYQYAKKLCGSGLQQSTEQVACDKIEDGRVVIQEDQGEFRPKCIDGCSVPSELIAASYATGAIWKEDENDPVGIGSSSFYSACSAHDRCYQTCGQERDLCDDTFDADLHRQCSLIPDDLWRFDFGWDGDMKVESYKSKCESIASVYIWVLRRAGWIAHSKKQRMYCQCCGE